MAGPGACRGVRCEAAISPTFSATPFSPTFGATPKILSTTPDFESPFYPLALAFLAPSFSFWLSRPLHPRDINRLSLSQHKFLLPPRPSVEWKPDIRTANIRCPAIGLWAPRTVNPPRRTLSGFYRLNLAGQSLVLNRKPRVRKYKDSSCPQNS